MATPQESIEVRAKTVEAALREGLRRLNLTREQVDVEVLSEGSRGILGFGAEDARIRLTPRVTSVSPQTPPRPVRVEPAPEARPVSPPPRPARVEPAVEARPVNPPPRPIKSEPTTEPARPAAPAAPVQEPAAAVSEPSAPAPAKPKAEKVAVSDSVLVDTAAEILGNLLNLMGINATVRGHAASPDAGSRDDEPTLILDIVGNDLGILIGRRGETLNALQYLTRLMLNHRLHRWSNVVVDVEEYKNRRERALQQLATRTAERVAATGRTLALEPMPARERRIIHMALRDHPEVHTESVGEGESRKVTIIPNTTH